LRSTVTGKPLPLLGGSLCLDFVNTIDPRLKPPREDFLATFEQFARWGRYVGVLSAAEERALLAAGARDARFAADVHQRALELREALFQLFRRPKRGSAKGLEVLNREIALIAATRELVAIRDGYRLSWSSNSVHDRLLGAVAHSACDLLTSLALARVRECVGDGCGWLFLDTSKAHRRRWCSMAICGNRAKAQRHRQRGRVASNRRSLPAASRRVRSAR
jgi:predicted RNA-binding Zn ribbon-like protein